jgi:hypothetical protein
MLNFVDNTHATLAQEIEHEIGAINNRVIF